MYEFLAGALGVLVAGLLWYFKKDKNKPEVLEEIESRKEELNDQLEAIEKEEEKLEEEGVKDLDPDNVVDFWKDRFDDKDDSK